MPYTAAGSTTQQDSRRFVASRKDRKWHALTAKAFKYHVRLLLLDLSVLSENQLLWSSLNADGASLLQVNALALVAGQVALLIVWSQIRERPTGVYVTARLLGLISALQIGLLSFLEHKRTIKPSDTLCYCLLAVLAADAIQARTLWLKSGHHNVAIVKTVNATSTLCLLILESWSKDALLFSSYRSAPKEMRIGIFDRAVFWWLTPLLKTGWLRVLEYPDLLALDHRLEVRMLTIVLKLKFRKGGYFQPYRLRC